jgi:hypothetical protein
VTETLSRDLDLGVADEPPIRVGLALTACRDLAEMVDISSLHTIPGTSVSKFFNAAASADGLGVGMNQIAQNWIESLCDDALNIDDYE